jgi:mannose-6-phosphate isomerase
MRGNGTTMNIENRTSSALYPLHFDPICQYRMWGGRRLADWIGTELPVAGPVGEVWLLSDRDDNPSRVAEGPLKGQTIAQLLARPGDPVLGRLAPRFSRFPLLLKFLDVTGTLSVQVHPADSATALLPKGETGKTEAWVFLEADPQARVYAGLRPGTTKADLRGLSAQTVEACLASFTPATGQGVLIEAGTVHALGAGVVVFEVQENSDVTFRLYDWDHVDARTGQSRALQVEQALDCVDFARGAVVPPAASERPVEPASPPGSAGRETLISCSHFTLTRVRTALPFAVGAMDEPRILVCLDGGGHIQSAGKAYAMTKGSVVLLPAVLGLCSFTPEGTVTLLEIGVPDLPETPDQP